MKSSTTHTIGLILWLICLTACDDLATPGEWLESAGTGVDPALAGPFAVAWKPDVRVDRFWLPDFNMDIYYPGLSDGAFDFSGAPYPVVVLVPDNGVAGGDYSLLARRLAGWGFVVALPEFPWGVPSFGVFRPGAVLDRLEKSMNDKTFWNGGLDLQAAGVGGVGAGGALADLVTLSDARFDAWFLLAAAPSVDPGGRAGPVLILGGTPGCDGILGDLDALAARYSAPSVWGRVDGLTAAGLVDVSLLGERTSPSAEGECSHDHTGEDIFRSTSAVLIPFLMHYLTADYAFDDWLRTPPSEVDLLWTP